MSGAASLDKKLEQVPLYLMDPLGEMPIDLQSVETGVSLLGEEALDRVPVRASPIRVLRVDPKRSAVGGKLLAVEDLQAMMAEDPLDGAQ